VREHQILVAPPNVGGISKWSWRACNRSTLAGVVHRDLASRNVLVFSFSPSDREQVLRRERSVLTTNWSESTSSPRWFSGPASRHECEDRYSCQHGLTPCMPRNLLRRPLAREIGNSLPNIQRQRCTCYALCHILYSVSAALTSIFRMDSNSTSYHLQHNACATPPGLPLFKKRRTLPSNGQKRILRTFIEDLYAVMTHWFALIG